jgi:5-hydroxyisourate hydrolase
MPWGSAKRISTPIQPGKLAMCLDRIARSLFTAALLCLAALTAAPARAEGDGRLTTHVLDTMIGKPGVGMRIDFSVQEGAGYRLIRTLETNADGRTDKPLLTGPEVVVGHYRLVFHVGEYFSRIGVKLPDPPFLDKVPLDFAIFDANQHYHVPLLVSPWSYSTYRGS